MQNRLKLGLGLGLSQAFHVLFRFLRSTLQQLTLSFTRNALWYEQPRPVLCKNP